MGFNRFSFVAVTTIASFSFPLSALALDARDFADKFSAALSVNVGLEIEFGQATANGDTITLGELSVPQFAESKATKILNFPIVFFGVNEDGEGGYSANSARIEDVDFSEDGIGVIVNDISFSGILIPANAQDDILNSMALYKGFAAGPMSVSKDGEEIFGIASMTATNELNDDRSVFSTAFEIDGIFGDLSKIDDEEARMGIAALGLISLEGRVYGDAVWELNEGRLKMDEFAIEFNDIGTLSMSMDFSGYTLEVLETIVRANEELAKLEPDSEEYEAKIMEMVMSVAARLSLNEFSLSFIDDGISIKILDMVAAQQGNTRQQMIPGLATMAPMFLSEFNLPELQAQVSLAVEAYLNDPQNIEIRVSPETSTPIMAFVALASNPSALLTMLNISVAANK